LLDQLAGRQHDDSRLRSLKVDLARPSTVVGFEFFRVAAAHPTLTDHLQDVIIEGPSAMAHTSAMQALSHVGIFAATRWEFQAIYAALADLGLAPSDDTAGGLRRVVNRQGHCRISMVQTGVGPDRATRAIGQLVETEACDLIVSAGFACALTRSAIGDLLVGTEAVRMSLSPPQAIETVPCDPGFQKIALDLAHSAALPARAGRIATVEHVLVEARQKHAAADASHAIGLDMESAALGLVAAERRIPFLIVRTVSDLVDEELPADFNRFLTRNGWLPGIVTLMRPSSLHGLWRLKRQAADAGASCTHFFGRFFQVLMKAA
jgi:adenosylhomocysteine nucleosidase